MNKHAQHRIHKNDVIYIIDNHNQSSWKAQLIT